MRWEEHVALIGGSRNAYRFFVGAPEKRRQLGRQKHRWKNNIKIDLKEIG
jgi:hypothetical protein